MTYTVGFVLRVPYFPSFQSLAPTVIDSDRLGSFARSSAEILQTLPVANQDSHVPATAAWGRSNKKWVCHALSENRPYNPNEIAILGVYTAKTPFPDRSK